EPVKVEDGYRSKKELVQAVEERAVKFYAEKEAEFPVPEHIREIERVCLLRAIDTNWMNHIDDMDMLRQGIGLNAYGQKDPLVEYKMQGYDMFDSMISRIQEDTVRLITHVKVEQKTEKREQVAKVTGTNRDDSAVKAPIKRETKKIQRNDPCPCGSGLKYKNCCGRNA
ncbi:MAG: SEC-C metal-binding domain-containing protein, partial [Lachnospiraceae bacterium]